MKPYVNTNTYTYPVSPPVRGAWIETVQITGRYGGGKSPPVRGAWIETQKTDNLDM